MRSYRHLQLSLTGVLLLGGCPQETPAPVGGTVEVSAPALGEDTVMAGENHRGGLPPERAPDPSSHQPAPTWVDAPPRLVAIGDLHGDLTATRNVLKMANVIDDEDHWTGGETVVVQVGDQLDRGDGEREIIHLLESLAAEAQAAGGAVYVLHGNHETMNVQLDLRYVTAGGFADFADVDHDPADPLYTSYPEAELGRVAAFRPGGPYAMLLSGHNTVMVVGDTVFAHGGVLPEHVEYGLDDINQEIQSWMRGEGEEPFSVSSASSPVWSRHYSDAPDWEDCLLLFETLESLGADRMVVAHTVQSQGISAACENKVWRVDVGLAAYYGGLPAALEIVGDSVVVVQE